MATNLPEQEQIEIAARIAEQAVLLTRLTESAHGTQHAETLQIASRRASRAAERAWAGPASPTPQPAGPVHEPTRSPTAASHGTLTPEHTPSPRSPATATVSPTPAPSASSTPTATHDAGRQQATPRARYTATPKREMMQATPTGSGPVATSPGPGSVATSPGPAVRLRPRPVPARLPPRLAPTLAPLHRARAKVRPQSARPDRVVRSRLRLEDCGQRIYRMT